MSAAVPADPTPPTAVNATEGAAVFDITKKRRTKPKAKGRTTRGRWTMDDSPALSAVSGDPVKRLADSVETTFNEQGLSLTDDETATTFVVTLTLVGRALEGAQEQGIVDQGQREELAALIEGMKAAPRLV